MRVAFFNINLLAVLVLLSRLARVFGNLTTVTELSLWDIDRVLLPTQEEPFIACLYKIDIETSLLTRYRWPDDVEYRLWIKTESPDDVIEDDILDEQVSRCLEYVNSSATAKVLEYGEYPMRGVWLSVQAMNDVIENFGGECPTDIKPGVGPDSSSGTSQYNNSIVMRASNNHPDAMGTLKYLETALR